MAITIPRSRRSPFRAKSDHFGEEVSFVVVVVFLPVFFGLPTSAFRNTGSSADRGTVIGDFSES